MTKTNIQLKQQPKYEPGVDACDIGVMAKDGIFSLTGNVKNYAEKYAAESVARVRTVPDDMKAIRTNSRSYACIARGIRDLVPILSCLVVFALSISLIPQPAYAQLPWMNTSLSARARTELLLRAMTSFRSSPQSLSLPRLSLHTSPSRGGPTTPFFDAGPLSLHERDARRWGEGIALGQQNGRAAATSPHPDAANRRRQTCPPRAVWSLLLRHVQTHAPSLPRCVRIPEFASRVGWAKRSVPTVVSAWATDQPVEYGYPERTSSEREETAPKGCEAISRTAGPRFRLGLRSKLYRQTARPRCPMSVTQCALGVGQRPIAQASHSEVGQANSA